MKHFLFILLFVTTTTLTFSQENIQEINWQEFDTTIKDGKIQNPFFGYNENKSRSGGIGRHDGFKILFLDTTKT